MGQTIEGGRRCVGNRLRIGQPAVHLQRSLQVRHEAVQKRDVILSKRPARLAPVHRQNRDGMPLDFDHPDDAADDVEMTSVVVVEGRPSHVGVRDEFVTHNDGARRQCASRRATGPRVETAPMVLV